MMEWTGLVFICQGILIKRLLSGIVYMRQRSGYAGSRLPQFHTSGKKNSVTDSGHCWSFSACFKTCFKATYNFKEGPVLLDTDFLALLVPQKNKYFNQFVIRLLTIKCTVLHNTYQGSQNICGLIQTLEF